MEQLLYRIEWFKENIFRRFEMKKVILFIHGLSMGGAETLVKDYALGIDKNRYDVVIVCYEHADSPYETILADAGIRVIYICDIMPLWKKNGIIAKTINHYQLYFKIRKCLRQEKPDVLHTHLMVNNYVKFARLPRSLRIIYTVHNEPQELWFSGKKGMKKDFKMARWLVKHYHMRFVVLHEKMRKEINELFGVSDTIILNNGIDFEKFEVRKDKQVIRRKLGIPQRAFVIGHVGRFSYQKNHEFIVNIFSEISRQNERAFLLLVGDGPEKQRIETILMQKSLQEKSLILSNRSDVSDLMSAMDAFVFPSFYEGLPIALIEAQKVGLPCFASEKVPQAARVSGLVTFCSLDDSAEKWADRICNFNLESVQNREVPEEWDMKNVIRKLELIYQGKI